MGVNINKTLIIWIDQNVNNEENKPYQKEIKNFNNVNLDCFENLNDAIKSFKEINFNKTIIITSGRLYENFMKELKACEQEINFIPKIIIFTGDAKSFISGKKDLLPLNDPFYNVGGVKDYINDLTKFIESSLNRYNGEFKPQRESFLQDEKFEFLKISNKSDLILPVYYSKYLKVPTEEEIKRFNQKIFAENINNAPISFLFSQLAEAGNIPIKLLTKFWLKAYSAHNSFKEDMDKELLKGKYNEYLPMIEKLYEGVGKNQTYSEKSKLYKGIMVTNLKDDDPEKDKVWEKFCEGFNKWDKENKDGLPYAILYGPSFFSFYKDEKKIDEFIEKYGKDRRHHLLISCVLEMPSNLKFVKNQAIIKENLSYFDSGDEVVFFPFSCFEVKKIVKKEKKVSEYIFTLNYLDKYENIFPLNEKDIFKDVPENKFSKLVFDSGIIDTQLINFPNWFSNDNIKNNNYSNNSTQISLNRNYNNIINNNAQQNNNINNAYQFPNQMFSNYNNQQVTFTIEKEINDYSLLSVVKQSCLNSINQNNFTDFDDLRDKIQSNLKQLNPCNWWVQVGDEKLSEFGNVNYDEVMIFHFINSNYNFYIHVAQR